MSISHLSTLFPLADFGDALPLAGWIIAAAIVVIGLGIFGLGEVLRFSPSRVWAISGVCFRESIRRRVLWIIPLAIIGVVIVSQLERAFDEQDIIRQTTKFCLFASGLVVTMVIIILAGTNLPKEIDNRVIYTIVTKPTTRLELVLGKTVGFARVSALILLIMGVFSYVYIRARTWSQEQQVAARLANDPDLDPAEQNKLDHYRRAGLLTARSYAFPVSVSIAAPIPGNELAELGNLSTLASVYGDGEQELLYPLPIDRQQLFGATGEPTAVASVQGIGEKGLLVAVQLRWQRFGPATDTSAGGATTPPEPAAISVDVLDSSGFSLINSGAMFDPLYPTAKDAHTTDLELTPENPAAPITDKPGPIIQSRWVWAYVPPSYASSLYTQPFVYIHVVGLSHNVQYFAATHTAFVMLTPLPVTGTYAPPVPKNVSDAERIWCGQPSSRGRLSTRGGQELNGRPVSDRHTAAAEFHFDAPPIADTGSGFVPAEMRMSIEHGGDAADEQEAATDLTLTVRSRDGGPDSGPIEVKLENKQTAYVQLPYASTASGKFTVFCRCNSAQHVLAVEGTSLGVVVGQESFLWNLVKSLFIMWLLTVLVVILAVFSSTFLSWPIAVVLTVVLLMGHWAVTQVADSADSSLGRSIATDMGLTDPNKAEALATSVNALTSVLGMVGAALPDIDRFSAIDLLENGRVVSLRDIADALGVLIGFGLPAAALAFIFLKHKEVAP